MKRYRYGLIGYPLGHSFSPAYFRDKFVRMGLSETHTYELFALRADEIQDFLRDGLAGRREGSMTAGGGGLCGLNVTIPYKRALWPYLAGAGEAAKTLGAVNVLKPTPDGWWGENTDVIGFEASLKAWLQAGMGGGEVSDWCRRLGAAVVLGDGGASAAVQYVLQRWGLSFDVVSRHPQGAGAARARLTYGDFHRTGGFASYGLCVQTTPVGMYPGIKEQLPLPYGTLAITSARPFFFYDVVYNPEPTAMMQAMAARGAFVKGGLEMLHRQAEAAWEIWQS